MPRKVQEKRWGVVLILGYLHHRGRPLRALGTGEERGRRPLHPHGACGQL